MFQTILSRVGWLIGLVLLQILVFNHVHIFGFATPLPYIYFMLILPAETPRWVYVLAGFLVGLVIDLFSSTPGMAAGAFCLTGLLVPLWLRMFRPSDSDDDSFQPSSRTMEWSGFLKFTFVAVFFHCCAFFLIEAFTFFDWQVLLINIISSTFLTTLLVAAMEGIRNRK